MTTEYTKQTSIDAPAEGSLVHARGKSKQFRDKTALHIERCIYKNGKFMAGGDFPVPSFELHNVDSWVYESDAAGLKELRNDH